MWLSSDLCMPRTQLELIFFFINLLFMVLSIAAALVIFALPFVCAGLFRICGIKKIGKGVLRCGRGYLILMLYILAAWGLLTSLITAALKYYRVAGLNIPQSPMVVFGSFPIVDMLLTFLMFPPGINVQLNSKIPLVRVTAGFRLTKTFSVSMTLLIDIFLMVMEWKCAGL